MLLILAASERVLGVFACSGSLCSEAVFGAVFGEKAGLFAVFGEFCVRGCVRGFSAVFGCVRTVNADFALCSAVFGAGLCSRVRGAFHSGVRCARAMSWIQLCSVFCVRGAAKAPPTPRTRELERVVPRLGRK